ncbi:MAG: LysR substrate-binding domain-containing protein, partial [Sneathiella sp.]
GRTQSAVSVQMQRLSDTIGQPILHRSANGVQLTSVGQNLLVHARRILRSHDEALSELTGKTLSGSITFGCPEDYLTAFLPDFLKEFNAEYPGIEIKIICAPTVELQPLLDKRQIEIALVSRLEATKDNDIIRWEPLVWIAESSNPVILKSGAIPLALTAPDALDNRAACRAMDKAGLKYSISFASNSLAALLAITRSGQAISVVTKAAVPADLYIISRDLPQLPDVGIALDYPSGDKTAAVKEFGKSMRDYIATSDIIA